MKQEEDYVIKVTDATVRFNMASEKIDNLKLCKTGKKRIIISGIFCIKGCQL